MHKLIVYRPSFKVLFLHVGAALECMPLLDRVSSNKSVAKYPRSFESMPQYLVRYAYSKTTGLNDNAKAVPSR